jgi:alpha/beta hydrolase fold
MSYWRHVVPLLTPHYTVIAVDNRGAGGSQRPLEGYDTATMAGDVAELATHLGFDQFRVERLRRVPACGDDDTQPVRAGSPPAPGRRYLTE